MPPAAESFFTISFSYRILALCAMLQEADVEAFKNFLCKSGYARLYFLRLTSDGRVFPPKFLCASKNLPFTDALAAGDLNTASSIAILSPQTHFDGVEYEDDFLFFHFLHRIICDPENHRQHEQILSRWNDVLEDASSSYLNICRALLLGDENYFESAFDSFIERRTEALSEWKETLTFDPELEATEGKIFIEGLAVLRIAEIKGIPTRPEYRFVPRLTRIQVGTPIPSFDSWRED